MQSQKRYLIPHILSFTNLSFGVISLLLPNAKLGAILILIAAFVDKMDGKAARKLHAESDLGRELDSLCDLVSFGIAPAIIAWKVGLSDSIGYWGYIPILIFAIAGAYRLARFNIKGIPGAFLGMPITAAGVIISLSVFITSNAVVLSVLLIILAILMISHLRFKKI